MRHSTRAVALMSETCFGHRGSAISAPHVGYHTTSNSWLMWPPHSGVGFSFFFLKRNVPLWIWAKHFSGVVTDFTGFTDRETISPTLVKTALCRHTQRVAPQLSFQAPCTPDPMRKAKQIRTRKSYCSNRTVHTAGNEQCMMQQATKWDLTPFFRVTRPRPVCMGRHSNPQKSNMFQSFRRQTNKDFLAFFAVDCGGSGLKQPFGVCAGQQVEKEKVPVLYKKTDVQLSQGSFVDISVIFSVMSIPRTVQNSRN